MINASTDGTATIHPREKLIQTASRLVHAQGWTATGINQILVDAGIPKGSFYYYFRSKEALGVAILQAHFAALKNLMSRTLINPSLSVMDAMQEYFTAIASDSSQGGPRLGCPIGSFANEIATQAPLLLDEANQALRYQEECWSTLLARGQQEGAVKPDVDLTEAGKLAVMLVQGAYLAAKTNASIGPFDIAGRTLRSIVLKNPALVRQVSSFEMPQALAS